MNFDKTLVPPPTNEVEGKVTKEIVGIDLKAYIELPATELTVAYSSVPPEVIPFTASRVTLISVEVAAPFPIEAKFPYTSITTPVELFAGTESDKAEDVAWCPFKLIVLSVIPDDFNVMLLNEPAAASATLTETSVIVYVSLIEVTRNDASFGEVAPTRSFVARVESETTAAEKDPVLIVIVCPVIALVVTVEPEAAEVPEIVTPVIRVSPEASEVVRFPQTSTGIVVFGAIVSLMLQEEVVEATVDFTLVVLVPYLTYTSERPVATPTDEPVNVKAIVSRLRFSVSVETILNEASL
jgi:hypothetical protein